MKYDDFSTRVQSYPVFGSEVYDGWASKEASQQQLIRWSKAKKIIRLKKGFYTLPKTKGQYPFSSQWLANTLYSPSYLSLEYALSWHGMIPERVEVFSSVSTLKTQTFKNPIGTFIYQHIKKDLFFGFEEKKDSFGALILMATPEKALLDFIYLHEHFDPKIIFFQKNLRLQQVQKLRKTYLKSYAKRFDSPKMDKAVSLILELVKKKYV